MKKIYLLIVLIQLISFRIPAISNDSVSKNRITFNVDLGVCGAIYMLKYYVHNDIIYNQIEMKRINRSHVFPSIGSSLSYNNFRLKSDFLIPRFWRLNFGYNFGELMRFKSLNKLFVNLSYVVQDPFYLILANKSNSVFPTSLIGMELTYQYKKFEFYYNFLKYRRFIALDAKEHQHILGVKYNLFREKQ